MIITPGTFQESELSVDDVQDYTQSQLLAANSQTQSMLDAALAAARRDLRWHVAPVTFGEVIGLDGHGGNKLRLPTKNIVQIHAITNDGMAVDPVADVTYSADVPNVLVLNTGVWSTQYSGITITWDHGFTNEEAVDWRNAILSLVTNIFQISVAGRSFSELESKQIDDVTYGWAATQQLGSIEPTLANFRLLGQWV